MIQASLPAKRILFVTQWAYEDGLIQSTLTYLKIIRKRTSAYCYLVTTSKDAKKVSVKKRGDIVVIELPVKGEAALLEWPLHTLLLSKIIKRKKIDTIHSWCTPASAVGLLLKRMNKKIRFIVDSYEPHAETMVESGTWRKNGLKFKLLFYLEKKQTQKADCFVFSAPGMENYIEEKYGAQVKNYYVKPTCVDLDRFNERAIKNKELVSKYNLQDKVVGVYAGKFGGLYLEDESFAFIKQCENYWGAEKFRFVLLSGSDDSYVKTMAAKYDIRNDTIIKEFVPHNEIHNYIGLGDFAFSPCKPVPARKYCSLIKNAEYWALGLPIVITKDISIDSDIIKNNDIGAVLETLDETAYVNAIKHIDGLIKGKTRLEIYNKIRPIAVKYRNPEIAEKVYSGIYEST